MPLSPDQVAGRATCLVNASEVPALFGLDEQFTPFMLHHVKKGDLDRKDIGDLDFIKWGNRQEPVIAKGLAKDLGWKIKKVTEHVTVPGGDFIALSQEIPSIFADRRMKSLRPVAELLGASLDYRVLRSKRQGGPGPLEIKAVGRFAKWPWRNGEPPLPVLLQHQSQIACDQASWGAVAGLRFVTGPADFAEVPRHEGTIRKILLRILEFEVELAEDRPPAPDFTLTADVEAMIALYHSLDVEKELDLRGRTDLEAKVARLKELGEADTANKKEKEALWASLLSDISVAPGTLAGRVEFNEFWMKTWPVAGGLVSYEKKASVGHGIYRRKR